jgi:hypothetical protein
MKLPFLDVESDVYINLCMILIIINILGKTSRGVLKINNERLHIFLYLLKNPLVLNKVMNAHGKSGVLLHERDTFSIASISPNLDPLFDRESLKSLLSILIAKQFINVKYKKDDGFVYSISEAGQNVIQSLRGEYLLEVKLLCEKLKSVLSISEAKLNQTLNHIIRKESE